jgi:protein-disulfide isomerase
MRDDMRSSSLTLLSFALLGLFSLGASCNGGTNEGTTQGGENAASTRIEKLDRVDTAALTDGERRTWVELVNEQLSPCGEPVSVAVCVAEARSCGACVPAARYLVRLVSEGYQKGEIQEFFAARFDPKKKVTIDVSEAPVKGAPMAKVTIVEFSDFECPYCGSAHPILASVLTELGGKVNLVFKNFPLDAHKNALPAARAAVAAQAQGKFWEMADQLFAHQRELSPEKIHELAAKVGLDMARFDADIASEQTQARVDREKKEGLALDVQGTPTFFVNGRPFREPLQSLTKYLREELDQ